MIPFTSEDPYVLIFSQCKKIVVSSVPKLSILTPVLHFILVVILNIYSILL
jgi:hypothetical protein